MCCCCCCFTKTQFDFGRRWLHSDILNYYYYYHSSFFLFGSWCQKKIFVLKMIFDCVARICQCFNQSMEIPWAFVDGCCFWKINWRLCWIGMSLLCSEPNERGKINNSVHSKHFDWKSERWKENERKDKLFAGTNKISEQLKAQYLLFCYSIKWKF